ncbi:MAG: hypothetical protein AB8B69_12265, partial [Chitinophagales bacterium]
MIYVIAGVVLFVIILLTVFAATAAFYQKVPQGKALVKTGRGGTEVSFNGMWVIPIFHKKEWMDISLKKLEIERIGEEGLICKDNMRADIKVVFFVRVNPTKEDVVKVAQTIGCERASDTETLISLFEAKFSEALKSVGKRFDFVELYNSREEFRKEIVEVIGPEDLNGYVLDDSAIDYLEQTPVAFLKADNILDAQGIKKIADLTAIEHVAANLIRRDEEKTIKKQDVEAREAILELERQLAGKEAVQEREIAAIQARETAEREKIEQEEKLKSERARIATEEEVAIAEQNKQRQVIVAEKQKEKVEAVETEKVIKERELEVTEREKVVTLAQIAKEKAVEEERKNIQDVIRERVVVERAVVEEEEKIKDTKAFADADRSKQVALTKASELAEEALLTTTKAAEADKLAAEVQAEKRMIDAEAAKNASVKDAEAIKILADAKAHEEAAIGKSEAQVIEAKADAKEKEGMVEAILIEQKALAEAKAIEATAAAHKKQGMVEAEVFESQGLAEAKVIEEQGKAEAMKIEGLAIAEARGVERKALAEAKGMEQKALAEALGVKEMGLAEAAGIEQKAEAMKKLDGVGREHEEFKLNLEKQTTIELAAINVQKAVAEAQAKALAEAFKSTKIDIVGGETMFYENVMKAIGRGKTLDQFIDNSTNLTGLKNNLLGDGKEPIIEQLRNFIGQFNVSSEDIKNLSIANLIYKMSNMTEDSGQKGILQQLLAMAKKMGLENET